MPIEKKYFKNRLNTALNKLDISKLNPIQESQVATNYSTLNLRSVKTANIICAFTSNHAAATQRFTLKLNGLTAI